MTPPSKMSGIRTAVAGVSGYAGGELARLLLAHPRLKESQPLFLGRSTDSSETSQTEVLLRDLHPHLAGGGGTEPHVVTPFNWATIERERVAVLFMAMPHEQSRALAPGAIARGIRVIDLSGAWRLHDDANRSIYGLVDANPSGAEGLQREAVYGCPEINREAIASARLVANPGCYATSIILALAPLLKAKLVDLEHGIICDAKSGVSGAGKAPTAKTHFMSAADNLSAYSIFGHRHTGELLEQLQISEDQIQFTPHLLPIPRGILSTIYLRLKKSMNPADVASCTQEFYGSSPMIRLSPAGRLPQIQYVVRTNYCDLGFELAADGKRLVIVSCLDNLLKGAAGQAVQNMNLMCGWKEEEGLL